MYKKIALYQPNKIVTNSYGPLWLSAMATTLQINITVAWDLFT